MVDDCVNFDLELTTPVDEGDVEKLKNELTAMLDASAAFPLLIALSSRSAYAERLTKCSDCLTLALAGHL